MFKDRRIWTYSLNKFTQDFASMFMIYYVSVFMTECLGVNMALAAVWLTIGRVFDAFIGLTNGVFIEKIKIGKKYPRYCSWINLCKWIFCISTFVCFFDTTPFFSENLCAAICGISYGMQCASLDILQTAASGGLMPSMAGADQNMRNDMNINAARGSAVSSPIISAVTVPFILLCSRYVGMTKAYTIVGTVFACMYFIGSSLMIKEGEKYETKTVAEKENIPLKYIFKSLFANSQLLVVIITDTCLYIGMYIYFNLMVYYFMIIVNAYDKMAFITTISTLVGGTLASMFVPQLGVKLGRRKAKIWGMLCYGLGFLLLGLAGAKSYLFFLIFVTLGSAGRYLNVGFFPLYYLDAGEYGYYKTGIDNRTVCISLMNAALEFGNVIGGLISSFGLAAIGYVANMKVTTEFIAKFMAIFGLLSGTIVIIGALFFKIFYKLKDEDVKFYTEENQKRLEAK